jgi:hypothetical protein
MIQTYKGRALDAGQKVKVYFNLHTHLFSVKDMATGLVVAHGNKIILEGIEFKVNESGRQRVLQEQRKNVHAYVIGNYVGTAEELSIPLRDAYYNPYHQDSFTDKETGRRLKNATVAYLSDKKVKYL